MVNGKSLGKKKVSTEWPLPDSVSFDTVYVPGKVEAVSFAGGKEISRDELITAGAPKQIRLIPEKTVACADGHDLMYVGIEITDSLGQVVPDARIPVTAEVSGKLTLAGFGSADPITEDVYTDTDSVTFRGRAMVILRAGYEAGTAALKVTAQDLGCAEITLEVILSC